MLYGVAVVAGFAGCRLVDAEAEDEVEDEVEDVEKERKCEKSESFRVELRS